MNSTRSAWPLTPELGWVKHRHGLICAGLVLCCVAIYGQTLAHDFINYDDGLYVTNNPHVLAGLSWANVGWAFTTERAMYVHPLTWMSHMLDCDLYGLRPWGHHLTNLIFHTLSTVLLFLVLARMTGRTWPSALAAALFAVHPLHVESVAWVAERKDVLSMFFWTAGLGVYAWHRQRPSVGRYAATAALFLLGYMSKPMVVTFPFVLLLLDYWPLGQVDHTAPFKTMAEKLLRLAVEKIPLFLMTLAMCAITVLMQMRGENLGFGAKVSLANRCANAVVVYVLYLVKTVCPSGLAIYYPHPLSRPAWQVAGAAVVLIAITLFAVREMRRRPWLLVGWLWYLGTLVPVIELVQAGSFSHADRYTYIPLIGIFVMVAWGLDEIWATRRVPTAAGACAAALLVAAYALAAAHQTAYWKNSETLIRHALDATTDNAVARNNLGATLSNQGKREAAREQYQRALLIDPAYVRSIDNLGALLFEEGKCDEAMEKYNAVVAINPRYLPTRVNLGTALAKACKYEEAEAQFAVALRIDPESVRAHCGLAQYWLTRGNTDKALDAFEKVLKTNPRNKEVHMALGELLANQGKFEPAAAYYKEALGTDPYDAQAWYNLGSVMGSMNRPDDAEADYRRALDLNPGLAQAHNNLAGILAKARKTDEAIAQYRKAMESDPAFAQAHNNLANLLGLQGKTEEAVRQYEQALEIDPAYVNARLNLANLLMQQGQSGQALVHLKKVLEIDPGNAPAREMMRQIEAAPAPSPAKSP